MVLQTVELKSDGGREVGVGGGWQHIQIRPQWDSVITESHSDSKEAVLTNSFKREKCPWVNLCPLQLLSSMS